MKSEHIMNDFVRRNILMSLLLCMISVLCACSIQASPVINGVTNTPSAPTAIDPVWITAQVTGTVSIASVTLNYNTGSGGDQTNTMFSETMATNGIKPWAGTGCENLWTVVYKGSNPFEQNTNFNYGIGNTNGLSFKATTSTTNLADNSITNINVIDARGNSGFVEFWLRATTLTGDAGWTFQLNSGSGFVTRTNELTGASHNWQSYHYDLQPSELVSNLTMRFQFRGGDTTNRIYLDQIYLKVVSSGSVSTNVAMLDDGSHQDGGAGDGIYGGQVPAFSAGTTVNYYLIAADSGGASTTNPVSAPGSPYSYMVTTGPQGPIQYDVLLGRPTDHSIAASVLSSNDLQLYLEYGVISGVYTSHTTTNSAVAGTPLVMTLDSLQPDRLYYYRLRYRSPGESIFSAGLERTFRTQRAPGSSFSFIIEADPHYLDNEPSVWQLALTNMLVDNPDFLIDLGDTFMGEKYYKYDSNFLSQAGIYDTCKTVRQQFFSVAGHSVPLFLVNGNHDPELGWLLDSSAPTNNSAVWGDQGREFYYPCPIPGTFYSGSTNADPYLGGGVRHAYYAFEWGSALFVMLDPFWYTSQGTAKGTNPWAWTLGVDQYQWLQRTLEGSQAQFKFVFAHNLVGGGGEMNARGGLAYAPYFEWGGYNADNTWGFTNNRPGWAMPIQSLLLSNGVNAFFHGHDHLFVKEDLDADGDGKTDLVYQECPQPSRAIYNATNAAAGYGYTNFSALQGNSGYLRVMVTPTNATIDYVRVYLPGDEGPGITNRMVTYSYAFSALAITETTNTPAAPTSTNTVWVTCRISGSTNLGQVTLTYDAGAGPTNVTMFDDGLHQDGGSGDGVYGGQIPALPEGLTVHYYAKAGYDLGRMATDPAGAPAESYSYVVLSPDTVTPISGSIVLGRPTDHSITVGVLSSNDVQAYLEYGLSPGGHTHQTPVTNIIAGLPLEFVLNELAGNTRYYYRLLYKRAGDTAYLVDATHTFQTQRAPGSAFTFELQGDSHPERNPNQFTVNLYTNTLRLAAADQPDFYLCLGDDFSVDQIATNSITDALVTARYTLQRPYLGMIANSAALFLVNGNHEQAAEYLLDGTSNNVAVWAGNARNKYYPEPAPDGFYTGDTNVVPFVGLLRDYYAWTWGDALFVTIDPYWHCPDPVDNVYGGAAKRTNWWDVTHGDEQYQWLKTTLEQSKAKYKFIFAHHVLGSGRGGIEEAPLYEWGGKSADGTWGFTTNRPNWPLPIHQLMVANNVTAFFQGHDHIFARQQLDGITYLALPEPADPNYAFYFPDSYDSIYETNNTGRMRVHVSPEAVKIDYIRSYLPADEGPGKINNMVDYSFAIYPLTVSGTTNTPTAPTLADPVWVTATVSGGTNILQVKLTYIVGSGTNTLAMLDDGLHQDGIAGDGIYGGQIPAFPTSTSVRYYVCAQDAASRQIIDPSGAPVTPNMFSYTVALADSVGDGIPDVWRRQYFGGTGTTTNDSSCATCDPDGDGAVNYKEYLADTNPTNVLSFFRIQSISIAPGLAVSYPSSASRSYTLYYSTNLTSGMWMNIPSQTDIPGSGGVDVLTDPEFMDIFRFYRIGIRVP